MHAVIFLFLVFYDLMEAHIPMANYWDELAACLVFCWGVYSLWRNPKMSKGERNNWIFLAVLVGIGVLGNIVHPGLQDHPVACIKDVIALCKFPVIFFVLERRSITEEKQRKIIADTAKISRWLVVAAVAAVVIGRFADLGFYTGEVRIVPTFRFVFSHPTFFISAYVMIAAALMAESVSKNRIFLLLDCLLLFMAQRTKGYIFIAFLVLFTLLGEKLLTRIFTAILGSEKVRVKPTRILLAATAAILVFLIVGRSRLEYFVSLGLTTTRAALHVTGIRILIDFFPLGSGFGTFASHLSGRYYSNLYQMYHIDRIYGMTKERYNFISDVYWPYIYGQFGIFGFMVYLKLIIGIFFRQYRSGISDASRIAMVTVWLYALIASTSEAYFTNGTGVQMALFLTLILGYGSRKAAGCNPEI